MVPTLIHRPTRSQIKLVYQYLMIIGTPEPAASTILEYAIRCFEDDSCATDEQLAIHQLLKATLLKHKIVTDQVEDASHLPTSEIRAHKSKIANTLHTLKPIHKYILGLRYLFNLTYYEIAELLETDPEQVRESIHTARRNYKSLLQVN